MRGGAYEGCADDDAVGGTRAKRILMVGAPGAGKGTQADAIAKQFGSPTSPAATSYAGTIADATTIGRTVEDLVNKGEARPDAMIMDMLRKPVLAAAETGGYVLDGFPRTVESRPRRPTAPPATSASACRSPCTSTSPADELKRRCSPGPAAPTTWRTSCATVSRCTRRRPGRCWTTTPSASCSSRSTAPGPRRGHLVDRRQLQRAFKRPATQPRAPGRPPPRPRRTGRWPDRSPVRRAAPADTTPRASSWMRARCSGPRNDSA